MKHVNNAITVMHVPTQHHKSPVQTMGAFKKMLHLDADSKDRESNPEAGGKGGTGLWQEL